MSELFKKLNLKTQDRLLIVNARPEFAPFVAELANVTVDRDPAAVDKVTFALLFVTKQHEVDELAALITHKAEGDAVIWFAYPKGSSRRYTCEFNRDSGWAALGAAGFEPVRQVAIDADWSALRFRRVEYIKKLTRSKQMTLTDEARRRTSGE